MTPVKAYVAPLCVLVTGPPKQASTGAHGPETAATFPWTSPMLPAVEPMPPAVFRPVGVVVADAGPPYEVAWVAGTPLLAADEQAARHAPDATITAIRLARIPLLPATSAAATCSLSKAGRFRPGNSRARAVDRGRGL